MLWSFFPIGHNLSYFVCCNGMSSLEDMPSDAYFSDFASKCKEERKQLFVKKIREVIEKHLNFITLEFPSTVTSAQTNAGCTTTSQANESCHIIYTTSSQAITLRHATSQANTLMHSLNNLSVLSYANEVFSLGLSLMEYIDSIKEGDRDRILRCWRYMLLLLSVFNKTKLSFEAYNLLAYYQYLFSPRMRKQLLLSHTCTVNVHGEPGKKIPMEIHMELLNQDLASHLGPNMLGASLQRERKALKTFTEIQHHFD